MRKKQLFLTAFLLLGFAPIILLGQIKGHYTNGWGSTTEFKKDGRFNIESAHSFVLYKGKGKYHIDGDSLTMTFEAFPEVIPEVDSGYFSIVQTLTNQPNDSFKLFIEVFDLPDKKPLPFPILIMYDQRESIPLDTLELDQTAKLEIIRPLPRDSVHFVGYSPEYKWSVSNPVKIDAGDSIHVQVFLALEPFGIRFYEAGEVWQYIILKNTKYILELQIPDNKEYKTTLRFLKFKPSWSGKKFEKMYERYIR